jgi:hypothetical protein
VSQGDIRSARENVAADEPQPHEQRRDTGHEQKRKLRRDAQMREAIIQQLLTQGFEASKRDKLLAVLVKLGISESEYRDLVTRLGEQELQLLANAKGDQVRFQEGERLAQTTTGEVISESEMAREVSPTDQDYNKSADERSTQVARSRADLYRLLQGEKTHVAKGVHGGQTD